MAAEASTVSPVATLFRAGAAAAVAFAVGDVGWLTWCAALGRVRELRVLDLLRRFGDAVDVPVFVWLPQGVNREFVLHTASGALPFLAVAVLVYMAAMAATAGLLAGPVAALGRLVPRQNQSPAAAWFWGRLYPLALVFGFAAPATLSVLHRTFNTGGDPWRSVAAAATITLAAPLVLSLAVRDGARLERGVRRAARGSLVAGVLAGIAGGVVTWLGAGAGGQPPAAPGLPNVLLVSIDSLRRDHIHCYGYPRETSPTIDQLAREGTRFSTVVSSSSWTLPAHVSLFTSLPAAQHGVVETDRRLEPGVVTLTQVLWEAGYATAGFASGTFLDALYGFSRGFDHYDDYTLVKAFEPASHRGQTSPGLLAIATRWLDGWDGDGRRRPFFVFLHMWDVHYDYTPPPPYDTMFDPDYRGTVTGENFELGDQVHLGMDRRDLQHVIALYDGEIRYTDEYLDRVLDVLRDKGVYDDTVVVVTADHGDEFFEHGMKGHGKQLYDETLVVPLVIRFPAKVPAANVVDTQVRLVDVAPTILELTGLTSPPTFGTPTPKGPYAERALTPLFGSGAPRTVPAFADLRGELGAMRTASLKFITRLAGGGAAELYRLRDDPGERVNVIGAYPRLDGALNHRLLAFRERCATAGGHAEHVQLSPGHVARLRALGYVQ